NGFPPTIATPGVWWRNLTVSTAVPWRRWPRPLKANLCSLGALVPFGVVTVMGPSKTSEVPSGTKTSRLVPSAATLSARAVTLPKRTTSLAAVGSKPWPVTVTRAKAKVVVGEKEAITGRSDGEETARSRSQATSRNAAAATPRCMLKGYTLASGSVDLAQDGIGCGCRIGRVAQRPADDEDGSAGADRVARRPDAPLIAGRGSGGTNAGHHDHRARSESFSQRGDIRWSTNDSVGARVHRETRQPLHFRRRCLQRGEHRHREQLRLRQRAPGRADHLGAAARMYGDVLHSQPRHAARRAFHRLRNVVQFEIEKNRQPVAA